jgi:hypothetical protein
VPFIQAADLRVEDGQDAEQQGMAAFSNRVLLHPALAF